MSETDGTGPAPGRRPTGTVAGEPTGRKRTAKAPTKRKRAKPDPVKAWVRRLARYRPNLVLDLPAEPGFAEDGWAGRTLELGPQVVLEVVVPTPRCAIPTLAHGALPPDPDALRVLNAHHVVEIEGFGTAACAGAYARVVRGGRVRRGDAARLA